MPFLEQHLRPVIPPDADRVARLLKQLDDNEFAVRQKASQELEQLGEMAQPALQKTLASQPSAEVQRRVEALLNKLTRTMLTPERLRIQRAVMVLEQIGTAEAREVLDKLSKGAEGALLTEEAKAAKQRMKP